MGCRVNWATTEWGSTFGFITRKLTVCCRTPIPGNKPKRKNLMDTERELTTGLLSKDASFRLIVSGEIGVKEIERLIKKLELDKEILADADSSGDATGDISIEGSPKPKHKLI